MSKRMAVLASTILLLCAAASAAFGDTATVSLRPQTGVTCWDSWSLRWWDINDNAYDRGVTTSSWRLDFGDYKNAVVAITINTSDPATLRGTLYAKGLKPNFAYQIKLVGKPTAEFTTGVIGAPGDDRANKAVGQVGRWWDYTNKKNATDADVANPANASNIYEGYLVTGFFITDSNGDPAVSVDSQTHTATPDTVNGGASVPFNFDSSYHVLCKIWLSSDGTLTYQNPDNRVPVYDSTRDSDQVWWHIFGDPSWGYLGYVPTGSLWDGGQSLGIYADYEPNRPAKGNVCLAPGTYNVRFLLTEESFHNPQDVLDGGYWQSAVVGDTVQFRIDGVAAQVVKQSGDGQTGVVGTTLSSPLVAKVVDAQGRAVSNATVSFAVTAGGGSVSPTTAVTGADGLAQTSLTLGPAAGSNTVTASVPGCAPATFTATGFATVDKVVIKSASYSTRTKKLSVTATSDAYAAAKLTMTAGGASAAMTYNSRTKTFSGTLTLPTAPSSVTVNSSLGGMATYTVTTVKVKKAD